jgi:xylan 1,4-beta-xylosidase
MKYLLLPVTLACCAFLYQVVPAPQIAAATPEHFPHLSGDTLYLADPTIFLDKGTYYLYGTSSDQGFLVYRSIDLKHWTGPAGKTGGYALAKGDAYGTRFFWAPQVFKVGMVYYMAYAGDEHIAIAQSDNPLGPFRQKESKPVSAPGKQIDPFVFRDTDGKFYLYHVRLDNGNRIFVVRLKDDLSDVSTEPAVECISSTEPWENTAHAKWPVAEGPTVIKKGKRYYLFYSANDFRNIDYAVGYATADSPYGPWVKYKNNPVLSKSETHYNGSGHGDFFTDISGQLQYVFHTHHSASTVSPRATGLIKARFIKDGAGTFKMVFDTASFSFLYGEK